jgi:hypothetical protein
MQSYKILENSCSLKRENSCRKIKEPNLFLSPSSNNFEDYFETDDFILQILCFLMDTFDEDNNSDKYSLKDNFNKIQSEIKFNFDLVCNEIKNTFDKFFYKEDGFFSKNEYNNKTLKKELINLYTVNKVSDIDQKVILLFHLLFEDGYLNFSRINCSQSIFENMYDLFKDIIKNYENHNIIEDACNKEYIKNNFPLHKIILTYQRYKIFFTYEDFSEYFYNSYYFDNNQQHYLKTSNKYIKTFFENLSNITKETYEIIKAEFSNDSIVKTEFQIGEIDNIFNNIKYYLGNKKYCEGFNIVDSLENVIPYFENMNNNMIKLFCFIKKENNSISPQYKHLFVTEFKNFDIFFENLTNNYLVIFNEITNNTDYIKFLEIFNSKNLDKKYLSLVFTYLSYIHDFKNQKNDFDGIESIDNLFKKYETNQTFINEISRLICKLIMDKLNIEYNNSINEDINIYCNKIRNVLDLNLKIARLKLQKKKSTDKIIERNKIILKKSFQFIDENKKESPENNNIKDLQENNNDNIKKESPENNNSIELLENNINELSYDNYIVNEEISCCVNNEISTDIFTKDNNDENFINKFNSINSFIEEFSNEETSTESSIDIKKKDKQAVNA